MHKIPVEDTEGFCSQRCMDYINFYMLFSRYNENLSIFLEKNLIGVKFIASILDVRKDNSEICSILWSKDKKIGKKYTWRIYIIDVISLALYLPLVISLDTYNFDCKNI